MALPAPSPEALTRSALIDEIWAVPRARGVFIAGAAGFGKTTLLAQLRQRALAAGDRVAWVAAARRDRDPALWFGRLITALTAAGLPLSATAPEIAAAATPEQALALLRTTGGQIFRALPDTTLLFDDYHLCQTSEIDHLLMDLIQGAPATLRLVVAGRQDPSAGWSKARACGRVVTFDERHLRFTEQETAVLLNEERAVAARLHDAAEGWPIALDILRRTATPDRRDGASSARDAGDILRDYFHYEVLRNCSADMRRFMLRTAVLDRFDADLGTFVAQPAGGRRVFDDLRRQHLMITATGEREPWIAYHALFRGFLRNELAAEEPNAEPGLLRRACYWLAERKRWPEAVDTAMRIPDTALALELMERAGGWLYLTKVGTDRFPRALLEAPVEPRKHPRTALAIFYVDACEGNTKRARLTLARVRAAVDGTTSPDLLHETALMETMLAIYEDQAADQVALTCVEGLRTSEPRPSPIATLEDNLLANGLFYRGSFAGSLAAALRAIHTCDQMGAEHASIYMRGVAGLSRYYLGEVAKARAQLCEMLEAARRQGGGAPLLDIASIYFSAVLYERDEAALARPLLEAALPRAVQREGWFEPYALGFRTAAALAEREGEVERALACHDQAAEISVRRDLPRLGRLSTLWRANTLFRFGRTGEARDWIEETRFAAAAPDLTDSTAFDQHVILAYAETLARDALAGDGPVGDAFAGGCEQALTWLDRVRLHFAAEANRRAEAHLSCLALALAYRLKQPERLADALVGVLRARRRGYRRLLSDLADLLLPVLADREALTPALSPVGVDDLVALQDDLENGERLRLERPAPPGATLEALLSPRQMQVLQLIAEGLSNKEIAQRLKLSEGTVKAYRRELYGKLEISSRSQAVARVRHELQVRA